jgi:hypothetical protein
MKTTKSIKTLVLFILSVLLFSAHQSSAFSKTPSQYAVSNIYNFEGGTSQSGILKNQNFANQFKFPPESKGNIAINNAVSNQDIQKTDSLKKTCFYLGIGSGVGSDGGIIGTELVFVFPNSWGAKFGWNSSISKYKNLPSDYFTSGVHVFTPKDYVNLISFNLMRAFPVPSKSITFGLDAGLSWVIYSYTVIKKNPDYDPNNIWSAIFDMNKYLKDHQRNTTLGTNIRASLGWFPSNVVGFEFAIFTSINNVQPVTGLEINIIFGNLK